MNNNHFWGRYALVDAAGEYPTWHLKTALEWGAEAIEINREYCDPEWPEEVEQIRIVKLPWWAMLIGINYEAVYDQPTIYEAHQCDIEDAEPDEEWAYRCNYRMEKICV